MYYWNKEPNRTVIECDKCGKVLKFDDKYFKNNNGKDYCEIVDSIQCPCGNIARGTIKSKVEQPSNKVATKTEDQIISARIGLIVFVDVVLLILFLCTGKDVLVTALMIVGVLDVFLLPWAFKAEVKSDKDIHTHIYNGKECPYCGSTLPPQLIRKKWSPLTGFLTNKVERYCVNCKKKF